MDLEETGATLGLDPQEMMEIALLFFETSAADVDRIEAGCRARGDLSEARRAAHSLRGASGSLFLSDIADLARTMEEMAVAGDPAPILALIPRLREALSAHRAGLPES